MRRSSLTLSACLAAAFSMLGCDTTHIVSDTQDAPVEHTVRRPDFDSELQDNELSLAIENLRRESERLDAELLHLDQRRYAAFQRWAHSAGTDFELLLETDGNGLAAYFQRRATDDPSQLIHAREAARYARLARLVRERLLTLEQAALEAESWQRYASDVERLGGHSEMNWPVYKAIAVAEQEWPSSQAQSENMTPQDIAREVGPHLEIKRQELDEIARVQEEDRQRRELELQLAQEERQRQEEAHRFAVLAEAKRQAVEQQRQTELKARAQNEARALTLFGEACHAYFARQYAEVVDISDEAIALNEHDPRLFYFRGLAKYQLGHLEEATLDFQSGGEAERAGAFGVASSLERVQGPARLTLEKFR